MSKIEYSVLKEKMKGYECGWREQTPLHGGMEPWTCPVSSNFSQ
jgi:hypothetical protein